MSNVPTGDYTPPAPSTSTNTNQATGDDGVSSGSTPTVATPFQSAPQPTRTLAHERFRIVRRHAQGGLGTVSVAFDAQLQRQVALKEMRHDRRADPALRQRFVNEAEITGQLEHPGIVPVYALEQAGGEPFYAMRFVQGRTLTEAIHEFHKNPSYRSLVFRDLLKRFADVCQTMAYAHSQGVIHRDLKPDNLLLGPFGEALVLDWGLAKRLGSTETKTTHAMPKDEMTTLTSGADTRDSSLTEAGQVLGTPAYMAPEQALGRPDVGTGVDTYALGAILYQVLCGVTPYAGLTTRDVMDRLRQGVPAPAPRSRSPGVPRPLEAICQKAMAGQEDARYQSALAMAEDVNRWLADEPVMAWKEPMTARVARLSRRNPKVSVLALVLLVVFGAGIGISTYLWRMASAAHDRSDRVLKVSVAVNDEFDRAVSRATIGSSFFGKDHVLRYESPLLSAPQMASWAQSTVLRWEQLYQEDPGNPEVRLQYAKARLRLAEKEDRFDAEAIAFAEALAADDAALMDWLATHYDRSAGRAKSKEQRAALRDKSIETFQREMRERQLPGPPVGLGFALIDAAHGESPASNLRYAEQARDVFADVCRRIPTNMDAWMMRLICSDQMANAQRELGQRDAAFATLEVGIRTGLEAIRLRPEHVGVKQALVALYQNRGNLYEPHQASLATEAYAAAVRHSEEVVAAKLKEAHQYNDARRHLAECLHNLTLTQRASLRLDAQKSLVRAEQLCVDLLVVDPEDQDVRYWLAMNWFRQAVGTATIDGITPETLPLARKARVELEAAMRACPDRADFKVDHALVLVAFGRFAMNDARYEEAEQDLTQACDVLRDGIRRQPEDRGARGQLTTMLGLLAKAQRALGKPQAAAAAHGEIGRLWHGDRLMLYQALCGMGQCHREAKAEARQTLLVQALELLAELKRSGFRDPDRLYRDEDLRSWQDDEEWRHAVQVIFRSSVDEPRP